MSFPRTEKTGGLALRPAGGNRCLLQYLTKANPTYNAFESQVVTANQDDFALIPRKGLSPLAREVRRQMDEIDQDLNGSGQGGFRWGANIRYPGEPDTWTVPGLPCVGRTRRRGQLAEFTLIVLKFSSLIKETATLVNPGSVKFSPGDRN